ncbi:MAG TPA: cytochrome C oxidase subunit IV family protein [Burkholderiaceae bacterium]|nr:cytochrome C oxidase subunit IV family protein [Burkholderiaceae bacterium]
MNDTPNDSARALWRTARPLVLAWVALLVLMLLSFGSAYLNLGAGNLITGLAIATIKTGIVVWLFMHLPRANAATRIAAVAGIAMLALLMGLSLTDFLMRSEVAAPIQAPQQIAPWGGR